MVDETDIQIVKNLSENADRPRKQIAKQIGISESSLSKRIDELSRTGIIKKFTVSIDYESLGYSTHAVSLIRMKEQQTEAAENLLAQITQINEAVEVYTTLGPWDIFVRWICKSPGHVQQLVNTFLHDSSVGHIETTTLGTAAKRENGPLIGVKQNEEGSS